MGSFPAVVGNDNKGIGTKGSHGMIIIGIPTPEKQETPNISLEKDSYSRKKTNGFIFNIIKERNQRDEKIKFISGFTIKRKGLISFPYWN